VELALDRFGRLDAAVLNAGIGGGGPLEATGAVERFDRIIAVNLSGVMLGIRAAIPALRAAGGGSIVATSSVSGLRADPGTWAYAASKAAVINLVRATAIDYAARASRHGHSLQQELLSILESAAAEPASSTTAPPPIRLKTVRTGGTSTWSREEIYGDEGR